MKRTNRILSMILGVAIIFGASSCKEDEPDIPTGGGDIPVADGFYFAVEGENPESTAWMQAATVDAPDFQSMAREGFVQTYAYLAAGSYNLIVNNFTCSCIISNYIHSVCSNRKCSTIKNCSY